MVALTFGMLLILTSPYTLANQLAGYTAVRISGTGGFLPWIDSEGWNRLAFINTTGGDVILALTALSDDGLKIDTAEITLGAYEKKIEATRGFFSQDIQGITFIRYNATGEVIGFQLSGSFEDMMLDGLPGLSESFSTLFFPHIAAEDPWETEIAIINTNPYETLFGSLVGYSDDGKPVSGPHRISIEPQGRQQMIIGEKFKSAHVIGYLIFQGSAKSAMGYARFQIANKYRTTVPAVGRINTGDLFLSNIASNSLWSTGISLVNTTLNTKQMTMAFDNGQNVPLSLNPFEHKAFTIKSLFGGQVQPDLGSAVIRNSSGVIGLEMFVSENQLSGIRLTNDTSFHLYYPHVFSNADWWTGIVAYNPDDVSCGLTMTAYDNNGTCLGAETKSIDAGAKMVGTALSLGLPVNADWLHIEAQAPITGFELFGVRSQGIDNDGDGFSENRGDCNDQDALIYPGAEEICGDGIDQDCDGMDLSFADGPKAHPLNLFNIGDSIGVGESAYDDIGVFHDEAVWSSGYDSSDIVYTLNERFENADPSNFYENNSMRNRQLNQSFSGAMMADFEALANHVIAQAIDTPSGKVEMVTIMLGANDICAETLEDMTDPVLFENQYRKGLDVLAASAAARHAHIHVSGIPSIYWLWEAKRGNNLCRVLVWPFVPCQNLLENSINDCGCGDSHLDPDMIYADDGPNCVRRKQFHAGIRDIYNPILRDVLHEYIKDGRLPNAYYVDISDLKFDSDHINDGDCFHPSVEGHQLFAEEQWQRSPWGAKSSCCEH